MWQIGLNFHNSFALALPRRAILAFRSIPAVGARIVAIASITGDREPSAKCFSKMTRICHKRPRTERATPPSKPGARSEGRAARWPKGTLRPVTPPNLGELGGLVDFSPGRSD
jgi:hypothetical protein